MVRPRSCRVTYYFDTPTLGRRHQSFGCVNWIGWNSILGSGQTYWSSLSLFLTLIFSHIASCLPFSFIWSSYTYLGVSGTWVIILPSFTIVYIYIYILTPSWLVFLSYYHGLPNKMWLICICTTSHRTSSIYFPILFNHCNISLVCLTIYKFSLLTRVVLASSHVSITSTVNNHTIHLVSYITSHMKDVFPLMITIIFIDLNMKCTPYNQGFLNR